MLFLLLHLALASYVTCHIVCANSGLRQMFLYTVVAVMSNVLGCKALRIYSFCLKTKFESITVLRFLFENTQIYVMRVSEIGNNSMPITN
jgi:hypothetical protein